MNRWFHLLLLLPLLLSCKEQVDVQVPAPYVKLNQPVWLEYDSTLIYPQDFVYDASSIDSITIEGVKVDWTSSQPYFVYQTPAGAPHLLMMSLWTSTGEEVVVLKKSNKTRVSFTFNPRGTAYKTIALKGEFNGWTESRTPLSLQEGLWQTTMLLNQGKYQYQIVLDGIGQVDPGCPYQVDNQQGGFNSLLIVGDSLAIPRPVLTGTEFSKNSILVQVANQAEGLIVLWNNTLLGDEMLSYQEDIARIQIPAAAVEHQRSWIRIFAWNQGGLSNDMLIPLQFGKVITDPAQLTRYDLHANILYNVFVDRFVNGDSTNDKRLPFEIVLPKANYMGGDIQGIQKKVDDGYFAALAVNTLWISPIVKNTDSAFGYWPDPPTKFSAYHGYWPISFTGIDSHFGHPDAFNSLITTMHGKQMNILLDVVANHVHQEHPYYQAHPDHVTQLVLPDGTLNLERWDEHRLTTWFDVFLPSLDLEKEEVSEMLSDSLLWWVRTYGIDGFRHDAAKHIPLGFWRKLTYKINSQVITPEQRPVYQLGETYGSTELINSYISKGLLDAQFDFNVYDAAVGVFAGGQGFGILADRLTESLYYYGSHHLMCNITGNQDRGRFISYAGGDLRFDENAKKAGWTREIGVGDSLAYKKLQLLMAFNMSIPGLPGIYYGDEIGMPGGNDPDCRRMMRFGEDLNSSEQATLEITRKLSHLRSQNMALLYGDLILVENKGKVLTLARKYFGNTVVVILNNSEDPYLFISPAGYAGEKAKINTHFGARLDQQKSVLQCDVAPYSFEIISINE
ncbi:MAG TPA: alpha-amylase family glycosyl hydrolase [Bacteroidales bacterium]|nr:alpha-amylase family glycosyl hydrolase [Bacteroidales bacterium]